MDIKDINTEKAITDNFPTLLAELLKKPKYSMSVGIWSLLNKCCIDKSNLKKCDGRDRERMQETKTYCVKYYKNKHCLTSIGVFAREHTGTIFQVFKCSQCKKIILEKLEEITRVYQ